MDESIFTTFITKIVSVSEKFIDYVRIRFNATQTFYNHFSYTQLVGSTCGNFEIRWRSAQGKIGFHFDCFPKI